MIVHEHVISFRDSHPRAKRLVLDGHNIAQVAVLLAPALSPLQPGPTTHSEQSATCCGAQHRTRSSASTGGDPSSGVPATATSALMGTDSGCSGNVANCKARTDLTHDCMPTESRVRNQKVSAALGKPRNDDAAQTEILCSGATWGSPQQCQRGVHTIFSPEVPGAGGRPGPSRPRPGR